MLVPLTRPSQHSYNVQEIEIPDPTGDFARRRVSRRLREENSRETELPHLGRLMPLWMRMLPWSVTAVQLEHQHRTNSSLGRDRGSSG